jgi:hypothetical protein
MSVIPTEAGIQGGGGVKKVGRKQKAVSRRKGGIINADSN